MAESEELVNKFPDYGSDISKKEVYSCEYWDIVEDNFERYATLQRCNVCNTYWEYFERYAEPLVGGTKRILP